MNTNMAEKCPSSFVFQQLSGPMRDTPPIAQLYRFEIVSQRGVSHAFRLVFIGYRAGITEIPLLRGGGIAPPLRMLSTGERIRKGGGGIAPTW